VPQKIINLIKEDYSGATYRMLHKGKLSDTFETTCKGVKQGCILSPLLFIVLDWILEIFDIQMKEITWRMNRSLEDMEYADDIVLTYTYIDTCSQS